MENSKRDKLINLREKENVMQDKEDIVSVRKKEKQFFQKAPHRPACRTDRSMEQTGEMSMEPEDGSASGFHSPKGTMEPTALSKVFDKAILWLLYLLVFSLPLFILPFSVEIYEFNKVLLLFAVSSLAFLIWIAKMVLVEKRLTFVRTPLDIPIIIFISVVLISTVFSVDKVSSILGFYGRFSDSLMVYLSLAMVYFVGVNCVAITDSESSKDSESIINNLIKAFLASAFVVVIVSLLYFFGLKFIPWNEAQFRSFNLVGGSLNVLAMYLVPVIIIALGYRGGRNEALPRLYKNALIVMSLIILALIDFILAWIILAISLFVVLVLGVAITKTRQRLVPTGLIILISLVFIASSLTFINKDVQTNFSSSVISDSLRDKLVDGEDNAAKEGFTREIIIEKQTAVSIAIEGAKKDPIAGIIGSGPGTYLYNFSKFKPTEFNSSRFWNIRFDKAGSEILEKVSTIGIVGTLSYLLIIILAIGMFLKMCFRNVGTGQRLVPTVYLFAAWFGFLLFQFLYLEATTTKFIFWLLMVILAGQYVVAKRFYSPNGTIEPTIIDLKKNKSAFSASLAALLVISASLAASYYYQANFYKAEMAYKSAVVKQSLDQDAGDLENIVKLNPYRGEYEVYLSNVSLGKLVSILRERNDGAATEEDMQKIGLEAKSAIDHIKRAIELGPNNVSFQQKLGSTYAILNRDLNIEKADEWAIKGYQKAIELEPTNPVLHTELGRIYVLQFYRSKADDKADQAIKEFEKAIELKGDHMDAILELGLAYEAKGDYEKAIETINSLESIGNISVNAAFQLGRIYYNSGENNEAKNIFLEIIRIEPNNSNARYSLGLIYEKEENNQAALREFELVLSLNPDNQEVTERVDKLKKIIEKENKKPEPVPEPIVEEETVEDETEEENLEDEIVEDSEL